MNSVSAIRMQQFGVHLYQASFTASDIDMLDGLIYINTIPNLIPSVFYCRPNFLSS